MKNAVAGSANDGILVDATSFGTRVLRNRADRNGDDGIDVANPASTVGRNRANHNGDLGIEAAPGVTDAGGNTASDNGNPAQCTNVACG
ncbi:MAG: hypothetical protein H0V07_07440 [Propionibacteriales bacterium]|nr:hypothetical protein [Propionibacteriales bacterium]